MCNYIFGIVVQSKPFFLHRVILTNRFILTTLSCKEIQSKLVYSNRLFATKNGKKEPIVKTMKINTKCEFFTHQERNNWKKKTV